MSCYQFKDLTVATMITRVSYDLFSFFFYTISTSTHADCNLFSKIAGMSKNSKCVQRISVDLTRRDATRNPTHDSAPSYVSILEKSLISECTNDVFHYLIVFSILLQIHYIPNIANQTFSFFQVNCREISMLFVNCQLTAYTYHSSLI